MTNKLLTVPILLSGYRISGMLRLFIILIKYSQHLTECRTNRGQIVFLPKANK